MPIPTHYLCDARIDQLNQELAAERDRNRRLCDALMTLVEHMKAHPGTDALIADLKQKAAPDPPGTADPTTETPAER